MKINAFEVAARYVYPAVRRRLVEILREKGLSQGRIAKLLHITQSAVSRYLSMRRGHLINVAKFRDIDTLLRNLANQIMTDEPDEYTIHKLLIKATLEVLARGYACSIHARVDPSIDPSKCGICTTLFAPEATAA